MNDLADRKRDIKIYPFRYPAESIQDYVKRLLTRMYEHGDLPKEEIERLQNLDYSKIMFGINYPLLITDYNDIFDLCGHARYWINFKLAEKYYVCSQWWKDHERQYNYNIDQWVARILDRETRTPVMPKTPPLEVGSWVKHQQYGVGRVTVIRERWFEIRFQQEEAIKRFIYPDSITSGAVSIIKEPQTKTCNIYCPACGGYLGAITAEGKAALRCSCGKELFIKVETDRLGITVR